MTLLATLSSIFRSRAALELENLALRHQIAVLRRTAAKRLKLTSTDRLLWICLSRLWRGWHSALTIVKPETVIAWHRAGFRLFMSVDAESNPDLSWAFRGAGANFGVMTTFECRLNSVGPVTSGEIYYPVRDARTVLRFFRNLMAEAPDSFQADLNLTPGERGVFVRLCHAGERAEAERLLRAFRTVASPAKDTVRRQEFAELAGISLTGGPDTNFRCVATVYRNELPDEVMDIILDRLSQAPLETVLGIAHYMHGEVCRVKPDSTAFPLRQSGGIHIRISLDWKDSAEARRCMLWADETRKLLRPVSGERIYANYQSYTEKGTAEAVFGNNYSRLVALKNKYDPTNFFRRNSNVEPGQA